MRSLLLLRPEPGLSASSERARSLGLEVIACPLFRIEPVGWEQPDPARYDGLLLTSANAVRNGGSGLAALKALPVHAVGAATAKAAHEAGFAVKTVGQGNADDLLAQLPRSLRLLHLAGESRRAPPAERQVERVTVYHSVEIPVPALPPLDGLVVAVHSPRAGRRLAELADTRTRTIIAAISPAAAHACGAGWERVEMAERPNDSLLLALAARLCQMSDE